MPAKPLTRRDLMFGRFRQAAGRVAEAAVRAQVDAGVMAPTEPSETDVPQAAVIQGRRCLAYRALMCSTCVEHCPVDQAIVVERGLPRVALDRCTGCGDCQKVCPAPENAILMVNVSPAMRSAMERLS